MCGRRSTDTVTAPAAKAAPKKKSSSSGTDMLSKVHAGDLKFLMDGFRDTPALVPFCAGLMRTQELHTMLSKQFQNA